MNEVYSILKMFMSCGNLYYSVKIFINCPTGNLHFKMLHVRMGLKYPQYLAKMNFTISFTANKCIITLISTSGSKLT